MKNIALLSILGLALLQSAVKAFFLGPIAVGAVIGALLLARDSFCHKKDLANKATSKYKIT